MKKPGPVRHTKETYVWALRLAVTLLISGKDDESCARLVAVLRGGSESKQALLVAEQIEAEVRRRQQDAVERDRQAP